MTLSDNDTAMSHGADVRMMTKILTNSIEVISAK